MNTLFPKTELDENLLRGQRVAFVGKLGGANRREITKIVSDIGGTVIDSAKIDHDVDLVVVGANELPIDNHSNLLSHEVQEMAGSGKLKIISESQFWQEIGLVEDEEDVRSLYTPAMLAQLADVPLSTVRRWQRRGLIVPKQLVLKLPYYDYQEVVNARHIASLVADGHSHQKIEEKLELLNDLCKELGRPLSQLSVIVEGRHVLLRKDGGLVEPGGQKRIDFAALESQPREEPDSAKFLSLQETRQATEQLTTPDQYLSLAMELEDLGENEQAIEVYRSMLLAFGPSADTCFQLAELFYFTHQYDAARERYYMAVELDETFVEARANLGCVLLEQGQIQHAINAFRGALEHHEAYPDVHFHLARALDQTGRPDEAIVHWKKFIELSPNSPWAEEASERIRMHQSVDDRLTREHETVV